MIELMLGSIVAVVGVVVGASLRRRAGAARALWIGGVLFIALSVVTYWGLL